jgi:glycosyltransferase involved in cell wall biosynthesis
MPQEPFISIVIPTRNRAHLLESALQSVLGQDFDDYELIVSDNCSSDNTEEVVREVAGDRARYVRPSEPLSMPDHWEFALDQARGQFITYLCDDDAWAPGALARAASLLQLSGSKLVVLHSSVYYAPDWYDAGLRNVVSLSPFSGEVREHRSDDVIRWLFGSCRLVLEAPRMLNSFCHRETIHRVRRAAGRIFLLCPDYSFAVMSLTAVPSWLYIDEPLHLIGFFSESIGSSYVFNRGEAAQEFAREFKQEKLLQRVPLQSKVVSNYITETYLMSREILPALAGYEVDWIQYFVSCWNDMRVLEKNGVDVSTDRQQFARALAAQPSDVREKVEIVISCGEGEDPLLEWARRHPVRAGMRKVIDRAPLLANLEAAVRGRKRDAPHPPEAERYANISGAEAGFENILQCAQRLPDVTRAEIARAARG